MKTYVVLLTCLSYLVASQSVLQAEVPADLQADRQDSKYDIGVKPSPQSETIPAGKGDVLVVYSASWCGPCQRMRPTWALLRAQGYQVVYIDIDHPNQSVGKYPYATQELVTLAMKSRPNVVPTVTWYNSETKSLLSQRQEGMISQDQAKAHLWKASLSQDSRRGLLPRFW